jgi:hypothetical protein
MVLAAVLLIVATVLVWRFTLTREAAAPRVCQTGALLPCTTEAGSLLARRCAGGNGCEAGDTGGEPWTRRQARATIVV